jgi:hypothetical protein
MTIKLSQLIPQDESYSVSDKQGREYEFKMFVPFSLTMAQSELLDNDENADINQLQLLSLECLLKPQHSHMTKEWIAENISLPHQNYIYAVIVKKVKDGTDAIVTDTSGKKKKKLFSR